MLKFIQQPTTPQPERKSLKYHPQKTYGNSFQCPSQFLNKHTIFNKQSYMNPFLQYDKKQVTSRLGKDHTSLQPKWTNKTNLSNLQEHRIGENNPLNNDHRRYQSNRERYHQQIRANPLRFRILKGQFTEFINKNFRYKSMGPLQGKQRTDDRSEATKSAMRDQQNSKIEKFTSSTKFNSDLYSTIRSKILKKSSKLGQKNRIKQSRNSVNKVFRIDIERRKKLATYSFDLPNIKSDSQFFMSFCSQNSAPRKYKTQYTTSE